MYGSGTLLLSLHFPPFISLLLTYIMLTSGGRYAGGSAQDPAEGGEDTAAQAHRGGGTVL